MTAIGRRRVTLTFDNGPMPGVSEKVLDDLAAHGIKTTFFIVGEDLRKGRAREMVTRAASQGHWIGNHTMTHSVQLGDVPDARAVLEIDDAQSELGELSHPDRLFRPYGGGALSRHLLSPAAVAALERGRYTCVLWNCVPRDWDDPAEWPARCLDEVARRDWSLVVLHDTTTAAMAQLPSFLSALADAGVDVVQEFPNDCVPFRRGARQWPIDHLMP